MQWLGAWCQEPAVCLLGDTDSHFLPGVWGHPSHNFSQAGVRHLSPLRNPLIRGTLTHLTGQVTGHPKADPGAFCFLSLQGSQEKLLDHSLGSLGPAGVGKP